MQLQASSRPADKARLRAQALARRDALDEAHRIEMSLAAASHGACEIPVEPGTVVSGFFPIRSEIDARPLMDALRIKGAELCVPAVVDRETIEFRQLLRGAELVDTGFGTIGPPADAPLLTPAIMLVPLAAYDGQGNRIGYGAGHYDRAIARIHAGGGTPLLIGLAFSIQEVEHIPVQPHDRPLHAILSEAGFRRFAST